MLNIINVAKSVIIGGAKTKRSVKILLMKRNGMNIEDDANVETQGANQRNNKV